MVDGDVTLTWRELDDRVNQLANALRAAGVGQGDRILWLGQNSWRVYELLGAAAKIGAMVCPGYWRWAPPEMAFAIEDFDPKVIIWQEQEVGDTYRAATSLVQGTAMPLALQHDGQGEGSYEAFLTAGESGDPDLAVDVDAALLVIYTAGSSGRQAGSMLSHRNLLAMAVQNAWATDVDDACAFLNSGPMFHIGNFQFWGLPVFVLGGKNVVVPRPVAAEILPVLAAERCTHAFLMPPTVVELVALNRTAGHDLSSLRAAMTPHLWEGMAGEDTSRWPATGLGGFGQTEMTGMPILAAFGGKGAGNAGRPGPFVSVRLLDLEGNEVPDGEVGEICARGDVVHLGYWNPPEVNAERFRYGYWHTTDLGRREPDGTLSFIGTMTRMLKSGAENIFPAEVENCIEAHPAVKEAAVIGVPNPRWLQDVKAVVVLRGGASATEQEIIEHCRKHIASYKKPKTVEFLDALPTMGGYAKDYAALDETFGGGGYPGGANLGSGG